LANKLQLIPSAFSNLPGYAPEQQFLERGTGRGESASRLLDGSGFDSLEDERHPEVKLARFETAERLTECEIADYVEVGEVEPVDHVEGFVISGEALHVRDELSDVALDYVFLLEERFLGEGMGESAALAYVVGVVSHG
jgi:hypothetical protein